MPNFKKNTNPAMYKKESGFKMRSGNSPLFKQMGSSPMRQEKHFLERETTIPMEKHEGGDPSYKSKLKSKPKLNPPGESKKQDIITAPPKNGKTKNGKVESKSKTKVTKGDVLQTIFVPQINPKKSRKVITHLQQKAIKKGKSLYSKAKKYLQSEI